MKNKYTVETKFQIWNDDHGDRLEVGPDSEGLGILEIRYVDEDNKVIDQILLDWEQARLLAEVLRGMVHDHAGAVGAAEMASKDLKNLLGD